MGRSEDEPKEVTPWEKHQARKAEEKARKQAEQTARWLTAEYYGQANKTRYTGVASSARGFLSLDTSSLPSEVQARLAEETAKLDDEAALEADSLNTRRARRLEKSRRG